MMEFNLGKIGGKPINWRVDTVVCTLIPTLVITFMFALNIRTVKNAEISSQRAADSRSSALNDHIEDLVRHDQNLIEQAVILNAKQDEIERQMHMEQERTEKLVAQLDGIVSHTAGRPPLKNK